MFDKDYMTFDPHFADTVILRLTGQKGSVICSVRLSVRPTFCLLVLKYNTTQDLCARFAHFCVLLWLGVTDFSHIIQDSFIGIGAIVWLPQCQWSNPEEYE